MRLRILLPLSLLFLTVSAEGAPTLSTSNRAVILAGDVSWNQFAKCRPVILTLEQVLGNQTNSNGGALESGGWQGIIPDKRSTSPPRVVNGLPTLVEIRHLRTSIGSPGTSWDECGTVLIGNCDLTLNLNDNVTIPCPACYLHKIHVEIDMYWNASKTAPRMIPTGTFIDVQGFVYWDPDHVTDPGHSYSGWELHPFTAWRNQRNNKQHNPPRGHCLPRNHIDHVQRCQPVLGDPDFHPIPLMETYQRQCASCDNRSSSATTTEWDR